MKHQMVRLLKNRKVKLRTDRLLKNQKVRLRTDKAVLMAVSLKAWIATPLSMRDTEDTSIENTTLESTGTDENAAFDLFRCQCDF